MTDPQRMIDGAGDDLEMALLNSARGDAPSGRAVRRALVAAGLAGGAAVISAFATASTAPPAASAAAVAGKSSVVVLVKWLGLAAIGGLVAWGALAPRGNDAAATALAPGVRPAAAAVHQAFDGRRAALAALDDDARDAAPLVVPAPPAGDGEPTSERQATPARADAAPRVAPTAAGGDLVAEVEALDQARRAMADDPDAALAAIDAYDAKFGGGSLGHEAQVLRIEALARAGQSERARELAQAFLARHPSSPLAQRVRKLAASAGAAK